MNIQYRIQKADDTGATALHDEYMQYEEAFYLPIGSKALGIFTADPSPFGDQGQEQIGTIWYAVDGEHTRIIAMWLSPAHWPASKVLPGMVAAFFGYPFACDYADVRRPQYCLCWQENGVKGNGWDEEAYSRRGFGRVKLVTTLVEQDGHLKEFTIDVANSALITPQFAATFGPPVTTHLTEIPAMQAWTLEPGEEGAPIVPVNAGYCWTYENGDRYLYVAAGIGWHASTLERYIPVWLAHFHEQPFAGERITRSNNVMWVDSPASRVNFQPADWHPLRPLAQRTLPFQEFILTIQDEPLVNRWPVRNLWPRNGTCPSSPPDGGTVGTEPGQWQPDVWPVCWRRNPETCPSSPPDGGVEGTEPGQWTRAEYPTCWTQNPPTDPNNPPPGTCPANPPANPDGTPGVVGDQPGQWVCDAYPTCWHQIPYEPSTCPAESPPYNPDGTQGVEGSEPGQWTRATYPDCSWSRNPESPDLHRNQEGWNYENGFWREYTADQYRNDNYYNSNTPVYWNPGDEGVGGNWYV